MIPVRLQDLTRLLGLPDPRRNIEIASIVTDSRQVDHGSLFAALQGSQVDGHDYAARAVEMGASALLVSRPLDLDVPQLLVADVLAALGSVAGMIRTRQNPRVVGITGSNGKTTVKEMLASILRFNVGDPDQVLATRGNYNNELGVPLTLFRLTAEHRFAVLEMGASKAGDIAYLAGIARPDIGVLTNVGPAHLEGFGSLEGVAAAKGEMFAALPEEGCAIVNGDQPWFDMWLDLNRAGQVLTFGESSKNDVWVESVSDGSRINTPGGSFDVVLSLPGKHNLVNAAAATAAAIGLGLPLKDIRGGLQTVQPVPGRLNLIRVNSGWTVIDDTYNANPASLYSALRVLAELQGTAWLVLGDMKELGEDSRKLHAEVGDAARALGVERIFATGELAASTVDAFGEGARHFRNQADLIEALKQDLRPRINCLVKGSRSMGMERVVEAITTPGNMKEAC